MTPTILISNAIPQPLEFKTLPTRRAKLPGIVDYSVLGYERRFCVVHLAAADALRVIATIERRIIFEKQLKALSSIPRRILLLSAPAEHLLSICRAKGLSVMSTMNFLDKLAYENGFLDFVPENGPGPLSECAAFIEAQALRYCRENPLRPAVVAPRRALWTPPVPPRPDRVIAETDWYQIVQVADGSTKTVFKTSAQPTTNRRKFRYAKNQQRTAR
jgi:hypothetical protein